MSRKGDGTATNNLQVVASVHADQSDVTIGVWYNVDDVSTAKTLVKLENGASDMDIVSLTGNTRARMSANATLGELPKVAEWHLQVGRANAAGIKVFLSGKGAGTTGTAGATLASADFIRIDIGSRNGSSNGLTGFFEHAFMFVRSLSDGEISALANGLNPSDLNPKGRICYYPLTTPSLANVWRPKLGTADTAVLNGTLPFSAKHAPVRPPLAEVIPIGEVAAAPSGRIMSSLTRHGGLAGSGGIAGVGGGLAR